MAIYVRFMPSSLDYRAVQGLLDQSYYLNCQSQVANLLLFQPPFQLIAYLIASKPIRTPQNVR